MNLKTSTMITGLILVMVVGLGGCGIADKPITTNTPLITVRWLAGVFRT